MSRWGTFAVAALGAVGVGLGVAYTTKRGALTFHAPVWKLPTPEPFVRFAMNEGGRVLDTVRDYFPSWSKKHEGRLPFMYLDKLGLVTTGLGNLLDTRPHSPSATSYALSLPWKKTTGGPASRADIQQAWQAVSARSDLAQRGGGTFANVTNIRLSDADIDELIRKHFDGDEASLKKYFPGYTTWPADAQLALHSMAWAFGPNFAAGGKWPKFSAAANSNPPNFAGMAKESQNGTLTAARNQDNFKLFSNAGAVLARGMDPKAIHFPTALA